MLCGKICNNRTVIKKHNKECLEKGTNLVVSQKCDLRCTSFAIKWHNYMCHPGIDLSLHWPVLALICHDMVLSDICPALFCPAMLPWHYSILALLCPGIVLSWHCCPDINLSCYRSVLALFFPDSFLSWNCSVLTLFCPDIVVSWHFCGGKVKLKTFNILPDTKYWYWI